MQIVDSTGQVISPSIVNLSIKNTTGGGGIQFTVPSPNPNPPAACQNVAANTCFNQWIREFVKADSTLYADLNTDGNVNLIDFEVHRRAAFP